MGIEVLDAVILTRDLPTHELRAGDVGAVVEKYDEHAFEVEFGNGAGRTLAVVTLTADDPRACLGRPS